MDEAYAVFDTLSVEGVFDPPAEPERKSVANQGGAPVLLRVPHVESGAEPVEPAPLPRHARIDASGSGAQPHTWAARDVTATAAPAASASATAGTNLRFDPPTQQAAAATVENESPQAVHPEAYAETLLQLDAIVAPYARWIALAAVIAAIGLTLVLLRDQATAPLHDAPGDTVNQAQTTESFGVFAELGPLAPITPTQAAATEEAQASGPATSTLAESATASGPVSAPIAVANPQQSPSVRLTGEVSMPEGYLNEPAPAVATRPQAFGYPRTAGYPSTDGRTRR